MISFKTFERICLLLVSVYASLFLYIAVRQLTYPGFLEVMEADALQHIERVARNEAPYPRAGPDFVPLAYMPLYYYVSAPFYALLGDSFLGPRMVSTVCAVLTGVLVVFIAWRESGMRALAAAAGAFYFSAYRIMDEYLICGLPDTLMLFWVILGYCFWAYGTRPIHDLLWLLCFSLAFWTKQQGIFFFGAAVLHSMLFRRNSIPKWAIAAGFALGGPVSYLALGNLLGEGFFYHTWVVPSRWEHRLWFSASRTSFVILSFVPYMALLAGVWIWKSLVDSRLRPTPLAWFVVFSMGSAAVTMTTAGSSNNHYIPAITVLCSSAALGLGALKEFPRWLLAAAIGSIAVLSGAMVFIAERMYGGSHPIPVHVGFVAPSVALIFLVFARRKSVCEARPWLSATILMAAQLAVSYYHPLRCLPDPRFEEAQKRLAALLKGLGAPVFWLPRGNIPIALAGMGIEKSPSWVALEDVERQSGGEAEAARLAAAIEQRIARSPTVYVIAEGRVEGMFGWKAAARRLELERDLGHEFAAVRQIATHWYGSGGYPRFLYRNRQPGHGEAKSETIAR